MAFKLKHTGKAFPFKTHKMYKGNKTVTANTEKEHLDYAADGYVHTPPKKLKDRDGSGDVTKKDLLIELGKLNEDGSKTSAYTKALKPCQKAWAKRKFDPYPSAYANMNAAQHKC